MPSKSVSLTDSQYRHVMETKGDEQPFSERLQELVDAGIEFEDRHQFSCVHCGRTFENSGAKATHEKSCPERPR